MIGTHAPGLLPRSNVVGFIAGGRTFLVPVPEQLTALDQLPLQCVNELLLRHQHNGFNDWARRTITRLPDKEMFDRAEGYPGTSLTNPPHADPEPHSSDPPNPEAILELARRYDHWLPFQLTPEERELYRQNPRRWHEMVEHRKVGLSALDRFRTTVIKNRGSLQESQAPNDEEVSLLDQFLTALTTQQFRGMQAAGQDHQLEHLASVPVAVLVDIRRRAAGSKAFIVDFDSDTVGLITSPFSSSLQECLWEVSTCASLSSETELQDMAEEIAEGMEAFPVLPNGTTGPKRAMWRRCVARWQQHSGSLLRSLDHSLCAVNLNRPAGFPLLSTSGHDGQQVLLPTTMDMNHLKEEYQQHLYEEQPARPSDTHGSNDADLIDALSDSGTNEAAVSAVNDSTTPPKITPNMRRQIISLKDTQQHSNADIASIMRQQTGQQVKPSQVQRITRGMPGKLFRTRRPRRPGARR